MADYWKRILVAGALVSVLAWGAATAAHARDNVVFVDWAWQSAVVHNRIAAFIVEHGYGYDTDHVMADTIAGIQGMRRGDVDVAMEVWFDNAPEVWRPTLEEGLAIDLGDNFLAAPQGWYVPTYVIEGDPERGIEPMAPDLRSVFDLPKYWELFRDPEVPTKGRFYNGITGWVQSEYNVMRLETYGLDDTFENFYPGSQAAADASIARAFERGEAWFGYYWEPTWIMGKYDMTLLEEPPYNPDCWTEEAGFGCAFPFTDVKKFVGKPFYDRAPELVEFIAAYKTDLEHNNAILAFMQEREAEPEEAALWFLRTFESVWTEWVPADVAARVRAALYAPN